MTPLCNLFMEDPRTHHTWPWVWSIHGLGCVGYWKLVQWLCLLVHVIYVHAYIQKSH